MLNFTSLHCGACGLAAEELVETYKKYGNFLKIVNFSLNVNKDHWKQSLERDKVTWNSVWDGKGMFSEVTTKYGVQGMPTFFLIDEKGIIIEKWEGYNKNFIIDYFD